MENYNGYIQKYFLSKLNFDFDAAFVDEKDEVSIDVNINNQFLTPKNNIGDQHNKLVINLTLDNKENDKRILDLTMKYIIKFDPNINNGDDKHSINIDIVKNEIYPYAYRILSECLEAFSKKFNIPNIELPSL